MSYNGLEEICVSAAICLDFRSSNNGWRVSVSFTFVIAVYGHRETEQRVFKMS